MSKVFLGSRVVALVWVFGVVLWTVVPARAQTYAEFFRQQKTQERYLLKQLAYLKLYAGQAWKGYELVSGGLETVRGITSGEMGLHEAFFGGLAKVSGVVRNDGRIAEVMAMQRELLRGMAGLERTALALVPSQRVYLEKLRELLVEEAGADLGELLDIVLSVGVELSDAQRLERVGRLHASVRERLEFSRWLLGQVETVSGDRERDSIDLKDLGRFYGKD